MRKIIMLIMVAVLCLITVQAKSIYQTTKDIAVYDTEHNIHSIIGYVDNEIEYKFFWHPQGVAKTWATKQGDCTDRAMLKQKMLRYIKTDSILLHGYCDGVKHDYLKFKYNNKWIIDSNGYCDTLTYSGVGIW